MVSLLRTNFGPPFIPFICQANTKAILWCFSVLQFCKLFQCLSGNILHIKHPSPIFPNYHLGGNTGGKEAKFTCVGALMGSWGHLWLYSSLSETADISLVSPKGLYLTFLVIRPSWWESCQGSCFAASLLPINSTCSWSKNDFLLLVMIFFFNDVLLHGFLPYLALTNWLCLHTWFYHPPWPYTLSPGQL